MYTYDQYDQAMVDARVEEFRDQVRRRARPPGDDQADPRVQHGQKPQRLDRQKRGKPHRRGDPVSVSLGHYEPVDTADSR